MSLRIVESIRMAIIVLQDCETLSEGIHEVLEDAAIKNKEVVLSEDSPSVPSGLVLVAQSSVEILVSDIRQALQILSKLAIELGNSEDVEP